MKLQGQRECRKHWNSNQRITSMTQTHTEWKQRRFSFQDNRLFLLHIFPSMLLLLCWDRIGQKCQHQMYHLRLYFQQCLVPKLNHKIHHHHHHHHVTPPVRISLTFSCHPSLSSIAPGRSSRLHLLSAQCCCIYVLASRPAIAFGCGFRVFTLFSNS